MLALVAEMIRLRYSAGRMGMSEYLDFRLHETDLSLAEKRHFAGWRAQGVLDEILVDDYSRFLSLDKISMYGLLAAYGLPFPAIKAALRTRRPGSLRCLQTADELLNFLQEPGNLPIYAKPSMGAFGRGNALITGLEGDRIVFGNGTRQSIVEFFGSVADPRGLGWILQEPLRSHAGIAALCGEKISGVRAHTFLAPDGPRVTKAVLKINVGQVDWDNFQHGASGNMLGAIDVATGVVTRVISGTGQEQVVDPPHPVSGRELVGFEVPLWDQTKRLLSDAALAFPGYICPGWDIAICDSGPRILEVNAFGDVDLSQHAYRRGFMDSQFNQLMSDRRLDRLLTARPRNHSKSPENHRWGIRRHHWRW
jgi:hypothetical protein